MGMDEQFLKTAQESFNPYVPGSDTELMAPLLYSLARMVRPRTVIEFGSGYTTPFLLRTLADNAADVEVERRLLGEKTLAVIGDDPRRARWTQGMKMPMATLALPSCPTPSCHVGA